MLAIALAGLVGAGLAGALAYPLARTLSRPIGRLADATVALAAGRTGVRVEVEGEDELAALAREVEGRYRTRAAGFGVELSVEAAAGARAVADHDRVVQVPSNRVENALRVRPAGGRVAIDAGPGLLRVRDTGPGLAPEISHAPSTASTSTTGTGASGPSARAWAWPSSVAAPGTEERRERWLGSGGTSGSPWRAPGSCWPGPAQGSPPPRSRATERGP